jgi:type VI secretion system protein VasJ
LLGPIKSGQNWSWAAFGKHPAAKDYFRIGRESHISKSFSNWTESGYKELVSKKTASRKPVAWRFWSRGAGKENLVCGLVKDSSDSLGRQYPLLIVGTGYLDKWEEQWDLLTFACEKLWEQIEYLSARMFGDMKSMETRIENIRPPHPNWSEFNSKRKELLESNQNPHSRTFREMEGSSSDMSNKTEGLIDLDIHGASDLFMSINFWHSFLKSGNQSVPNAVFMGGTVEHSFLAFFKRPLATADFIRLWSVSSAGAGKEGSSVTG